MSQTSKYAEYRLPPGRHGIPPEEVAANQRWRLLGATAEVFSEVGRLGTTSTAVARRAGVSPATFYKHFENISDCLLATFEMSAASLLEAVEAACRERDLPWQRRLREALDSALRFLAAEPAIAAMLGTAAPVAEPSISEAREDLVERLSTLLSEGRENRPEKAPELPAGHARLAVGAALMVISDLVGAGEAERLPRLSPELAELLG